MELAMFKTCLSNALLLVFLFSSNLAYAQQVIERERARGTDWGGVICASPILILFIFLVVQYGAPESGDS
jgi:hypothetical protein